MGMFCTVYQSVVWTETELPDILAFMLTPTWTKVGSHKTLNEKRNQDGVQNKVPKKYIYNF